MNDITEREKLAGKEHKGIAKEIEDKWADLKKDIRRLARACWAAINLTNHRNEKLKKLYNDDGHGAYYKSGLKGYELRVRKHIRVYA